MTTNKDLVRLFDDFVNDHGLWRQWKAYAKERGYTMGELGFNDDEDDTDNDAAE